MGVNDAQQGDKMQRYKHLLRVDRQDIFSSRSRKGVANGVSFHWQNLENNNAASDVSIVVSFHWQNLDNNNAVSDVSIVRTKLLQHSRSRIPVLEST